MPDKKKTAATKESGVTIVSSTGHYFTAPEVTAELLVDLQSNVYGKGLALKQKNLLFSKKYSLEVLDPKGKQDEELEQRMLRMCNSRNVNLWAKIQIAWWDQFWFGPGIFNEVWNYIENEYVLLKLRHLPAHSFRDFSPKTNFKIYSQILQGIGLNDKGEFEYYQIQEDGGIPQLVKNIYMVKNPTNTELAGEPVVLPLVSVIAMLNYTWDTQMKQANRTGAKVLFIKLTNPLPASEANENVSDLDAAQLILENWGNDTAYTLRESMEIIDPQIKDDSNNLEIIEALNQMLIDYISPINFLTAANDAARLGGNDSQRMDMILRYIQSEHLWLEEDFSRLLQTYLDVNGYVDYTVNVKIPKPELDTSEVDLKRADIGLKAKVLFPNELRMLLGHEEKTDKEMADLTEHYKNVQPEMPTFGMMNAQSSELRGAIDKVTEVGENLSERVIAALRREEES